MCLSVCLFDVWCLLFGVSCAFFVVHSLVAVVRCCGCLWLFVVVVRCLLSGLLFYCFVCFVCFVGCSMFVVCWLLVVFLCVACCLLCVV